MRVIPVYQNLSLMKLFRSNKKNNMRKHRLPVMTVVMILMSQLCFSQTTTSKTIKTEEDTLGTGLPGDNLDLYAVLALFQKSKTIEEFEKSLNDETGKINNLDLDGDNTVDFIKVETKQDGDNFTFILQDPISNTETQDVAVIMVSKDKNKKITLQIIGDEALYGKNYIIEPKSTEKPKVTANPAYTGTDVVLEATPTKTTANTASSTTVVVESSPIIVYVYSPVYVPYYPPYYYGYYPPYFRPYPPVRFSVYHHHHYYHHVSYSHTTVIHNTNNYKNYNNNYRHTSNTVNHTKATGNYSGNKPANTPSHGNAGGSKPATPSTLPAGGVSGGTKPASPSTRPSGGGSGGSKPASPSTQPAAGKSDANKSVSPAKPSKSANRGGGGRRR